MKNILPVLLLASILFANRSNAQMQVDKQLQMIGSNNTDKQITGVGNPSASDHAVNVKNIQTGELVYAAATGSGGNYMVLLTPTPTAFPAGMPIYFTANHTNTGAATLNINGLGAKPLLKNGSMPLVAGDISTGQVVAALYDGSTNYHLLSATGTVSTGSGNYIQNQIAADQSAGFRITGNGIFNGGNVGIGTAAPSEKLQVLGNILLGGSEDAGVSQYTIKPLSGSGAFNSGNGRELFVEAGISDNAPAKRGGHLYLRPGAPNAPATLYGSVLIADLGGNVGIGTASPSSKLDVAEGVVALSGSAGVSHGIRFDRGPALATSGAIQATIFQELNGIGGSSEALTFRSDNYKFQNYDGTEEIYFRGGLIGIRASNPVYYLQVGDHIAGNNTAYSLGVLRNGTAASPGTYSANSPAVIINDFSNDGPGALESTGLLYIVAGRIADADVNAGNANLLAIQNDNGYAITVKGNRRVGLGTNSPGGQLELSLDQGRKPGTSLWTIVSDERLKQVDGIYNKGLNELMQLHPITYHYKNNGGRQFPEEVLNTQYVGFAAQDVQKVFPESVAKDEDGYLSLNMHAMLVAYVNALKEQQQQIDKLKEQNNVLLQRLEKLEK